MAASVDQEVLAHPAAVGRVAASWLVIGGAALFLIGLVAVAVSDRFYLRGGGAAAGPHASPDFE